MADVHNSLSNSLSISVPLRVSNLFSTKHGQIKAKDLTPVLKRTYALPRLPRESVVPLTLSWHTPQGALFRHEVVTIIPQSCYFGNARWWLRCATCRRRCYDLFWRKDRFACRSCQRLRYLSKNVSDPYRLMHHFGDLTEHLRRKPGPKPRRYLRLVQREDEACRRVLADLERFGLWGHDRSGQLRATASVS